MYGSVQDRELYEGQGLGIAPIAVAGAATGAIRKIGSAISGLLGGGPSKEQKPGGAEYEFRKATAQAADSMAREGNVNAWHFLGGLGRVKGLPIAFQLPGLPKRSRKTATGSAGASYSDKVLPVGWMADKWGSSFQPIQTFAADEYRAIEGQAPSAVGPGATQGAIGASAPSMRAGVSPVLLGALALGAVVIATRRR